MKICGSCATENDDTRVFCLNCGTRLPAPVPGSPPGVSKPSQELYGASAPQISQRKPEKPPAKLRQAGLRPSAIVSRILFLAALVGTVYAVVLILEPPKEIPQRAAVASAEDSARMISFLRDVSKSPGGAWQGDENAINRFLAANVRLSPLENPLGVQVAFRRCFLKLSQGMAAFTMEVSVFDRSIYLQLDVVPVTRGGELEVNLVGASLGRLPVPGILSEFLLPLWSPCFESLDQVLTLLEGARSAEITPGRVVVRWPDTSLR